MLVDVYGETLYDPSGTLGAPWSVTYSFEVDDMVYKGRGVEIRYDWANSSAMTAVQEIVERARLNVVLNFVT